MSAIQPGMGVHVSHMEVPPPIQLTKEQLVLEGRVNSILKEVEFRPRAECNKYNFFFDVRRQLINGSHFSCGEWWNTRKWFISEHATDSEILQTILKLCITSAEHEARENFLYRNRAIYGPHLNKDMLWENAGNTEER